MVRGNLGVIQDSFAFTCEHIFSLIHTAPLPGYPAYLHPQALPELSTEFLPTDPHLPRNREFSIPL